MIMDPRGVRQTGWLLEDFNQSDSDVIPDLLASAELDNAPEPFDYTIANTWTDGYMSAGRRDLAERSDGGPSAAFLQSLQDMEARLVSAADGAAAQMASLLLTAFTSLGMEKRVEDTAACIRDLMQLIRPALRGAIPVISLHTGDNSPPTVISQDLLDGGVMKLPAADQVTISWGLGEAHVDWRATTREVMTALAPLTWATVAGEESQPP
jgi:hypothetical protein